MDDGSHVRISVETRSVYDTPCEWSRRKDGKKGKRREGRRFIQGWLLRLSGGFRITGNGPD